MMYWFPPSCGKLYIFCGLPVFTLQTEGRNSSLLITPSSVFHFNISSEAVEGTWGWGGTDDGVYVSMRTLGRSGTCSPPNFFKIRCSEIASEAIFVLKSGQFLPWTYLVPLCDKIVQGSLSHHCTYSRYTWLQFKRGQKGHGTRQFEGGALKGKFLPRGVTCPWCPPPPVPPPMKFAHIYMQCTCVTDMNSTSNCKQICLYTYHI